MNLGEAEYNGLQNQISYRGSRRFFASISYTLSKATNTTEPDGNGIGPNESLITELGEQERGPSVVDQRHRPVFHAAYNFPWNFAAGTLMQFASARPFNSTTGVDNNGDGIQNDRPVIDGVVVPKSAFRGRGTQDVSVYVQNRIRLSERTALTLRLEGFNIFNHANMLGRGARSMVTAQRRIRTLGDSYRWAMRTQWPSQRLPISIRPGCSNSRRDLRSTGVQLRRKNGGLAAVFI